MDSHNNISINNRYTSATTPNRTKPNTPEVLKKKKESPPQKVYKVICVEDNSLVQKMLQHTFSKSANIELVSYFTGEECIKDLADKPDIAILDYYLSVDPRALNGLNVLEMIAKNSPETKVIMLSSQEQVKVAIECLRKGAIDYVVKDEGIRINIQRVISNIIKSVELKDEIMLLSKRIKRDKLLMKGHFTIFLIVIFLLIFIF